MNVFFSPVHLPRTRSRRSAFSLLEVAFALVIFVIGAIALLRIFPGGLSVLEDSGNRRIASQVSQNVVQSYTSGDLASTTPDTIYDVVQDGGPNDGAWLDYGISPFGLRRQQGTLPVNADDFDSAKNRVNHIRGEKQGISGGTIYTNYAADKKIELVRDGVVNNVDINSKGLLDFRNAIYSSNQRSNKPNLPFREPILGISSLQDATVATSKIPVPLNGDTAVIKRPTAGAPTATYEVVFSIDSTSISSGMMFDFSTLPTTPALVSFAPGGTGCILGTETHSPNFITVQFTVPAVTSPTAQANEVVTFSPSTTITGVSTSRAGYRILISSDGTSSPAPVSSSLLPVRAPYGVRNSPGVVFYTSYNWTTAAGTSPVEYKGAVDQPTSLPAGTADEAVAFSTLNPTEINNGTYAVSANPNATIKFRQPLTVSSVGPDRVSLPLPTFSFADSDGSISSAELSQVSLDYNVQSWEYISEDISQFGTPFTDPTVRVNTNTPDGLAQFGFMDSAGYAMNQIPLADIREIRTKFGNLRGKVQVKGFYDQSKQPLNVEFNINDPTPPTSASTTTVTTQALARQKKILGKEGRLYLPANFYSGTTTPPLSLSHARVYYRSKDAWAQQVGVTANHYVPFLDTATIPHEQWREYYMGSDRFLYFHAIEAGKTVEVVHGTNSQNQQADTVEIQPDVLYVDALPAGMLVSSTNFSTTKFNNPKNMADPRNGKFCLARSRNRINDNVFDIRRLTGTSGISVRTLWLNNNRYSQEIAQ